MSNYCGTKIGILFDEPQDILERQDGTDSRFEMMSSTSVEAISKAIIELGFPTPEVISSANLFDVISTNKKIDFDLAMNLSSGIVDRWRYAQGPMALELLRIPYSGSSLFSILICRDKYRCKLLCRDIVPTPPAFLITQEKLSYVDDLKKSIFPAILKPNAEGGSVGLDGDVIVTNPSDAKKRANYLLKSYPDGVLLEHFIAGVEITAVVLCNGHSRQVHPFTLANRDGSRLSNKFIRTQEEKANAFKTGDRTWFEASKSHGKPIHNLIVKAAEDIARALDLRDLARIDFRLSAGGDLYFIEANAQPSFVPGNTSLFRCSELVFDDPLGVEKSYIKASLERTQPEISYPSK